MPDRCTKIIDCLIERRKQCGLTQQELANAAKLTQSVIARLENKKVMPKLDTLLRVADALNCRLEII